jgi:hypothetical protein
MTEETHRQWDIIFKWLGLVAVLASAWWTVHSYNQSRALELLQQKYTQQKDEEARTKDQNSFVFQRSSPYLWNAGHRSGHRRVQRGETDGTCGPGHHAALRALVQRALGSRAEENRAFPDASSVPVHFPIAKRRTIRGQLCLKEKRGVPATAKLEPADGGIFTAFLLLSFQLLFEFDG